LVEVAEQMRAIGDRWQEAAQAFLQASKADTPLVLLSEASAALMEIADREQMAWKRLMEIAAVA
ncbi:MAG: hypothetical protein C0393_08330, partial [Anaerolinea sp.]|nr:hypothetical protein [Anaerolinea sp.]